MNPFAMPDGDNISDEDLKNADAAVYVISRISGEGKDRKLEEGDYYLSRKERADLKKLDACHLPIILLINSGGPVELASILQEVTGIKAVLNLSQLGQEGGHAVADILLGRHTPEGRLTSTWAEKYQDYPSGMEFSHLNADLENEFYREGIYVGYRYFDSAGVRPLFPFGFGLSYTAFRITPCVRRIEESFIIVEAEVRNTGNFSGREVVQLYLLLSKLDQPCEVQRLCGFAKTGMLKPGESETVTIKIDQKSFAVYQEAESCWKVLHGLYQLAAGSSSRDTDVFAGILVEQDTVIEKTHSVFTAHPYKDETDALFAGFETGHIRKNSDTSCDTCLFRPVLQKTSLPRIPDEYQEISTEEMIPLLYGNITIGASNLGSAGKRVPGSAGETSEALERNYGIRSLIMADGPAGLRLRQSYEVDRSSGEVYGVGVFGSLENGILEPEIHHEDAETFYQYCTAFPVGTALAQTWDIDLLKEFGKAVAEEMREFHVDLWLAPGMNIQRNPLCGRNFEYYSEDPYLSGMLAAAVTEGVQSEQGCGVTIKHFTGNNQEDNRMGVNARISEKALREIYLRGFEIAVSKSKPAAIMTSYNKINGVHAANSYDLCETIARKEWGFEGIIMSDWNTTVPEDGSIPWQCASAGNDIIMPGNPDDDQNIRQALQRGDLKEADIRKSACRVIRLVKKLTGIHNLCNI